MEDDIVVAKGCLEGAGLKVLADGPNKGQHALA